MPIACVDLFVLDEDKRILLLKRKNQPSKGQWWFPGGRILHGELRTDAVIRKLKEETKFTFISIKEISTHDVILDLANNKKSHGVTTVFEVIIDKDDTIILDNQSTEYKWASKNEWLKEPLHEFILTMLKNIEL